MSNSHKASPEQRRALAQHAYARESPGNHLQPTVMALPSKAEDPASTSRPFIFCTLSCLWGGLSPTAANSLCDPPCSQGKFLLQLNRKCEVTSVSLFQDGFPLKSVCKRAVQISNTKTLTYLGSALLGDSKDRSQSETLVSLSPALGAAP